MLLRLYENNNSYESLQTVTDLLNDGGIFIFPTDGRYAIGCHALNTHAVEAVCRLKGINPMKNHLSIICYDLSSISEFTQMSDATFKLIKRNVPGPFTFILPGTGKLPKIFMGRKEVGIRMPNNPIIMEIVRSIDAPVLTASLPVPDEEEDEYYTNPELIDEMFGHMVDLVIDGGIGHNWESTIVNCTKGTPEVTRQGIGILDA